MKDYLVMFGIIAAWFVLQKFILPSLGVRT